MKSLNVRRWIWSSTALTIVMMSVMACSAIGAKPAVVISSPPSGSTYHEGDDVAVQSTSADQTGVARVELTVDGAVVRNDTPPATQTNFSLIQTWKATQGNHTIAVRAYNAAGLASDPAAISISVAPSVALGATPTATSTSASVAPAAPTATNAPAPTGATSSACTDNAAFVTDVTVPDGTVWAAGQAFNKIWRLSNNGTCAWSAGYQFVFISGEAMTASTVVSAPPTAPGATADILVAMNAPTTPGNHSGKWRMRSAGGAVFGQTISIKITVPGAPPPAPPSSCTGTPVIASFTASASTILKGGSTTLNWGAVTNADSVEIDQGIGGVPAPGSTSVSPGSTTTYTMTAHCGSNTKTAQVTVTVNTLVFPPPIILLLPATSQVLAQTSIGAGANGSTYAACPGGSIVTGGGYASNHTPGIEVYTSLKDGNGWRVYANNATASPFTLNAYAVCLSNSGGSTDFALASTSIAASSTGHATVGCPAGSVVTGGGFAGGTGTKIYTQDKSGNGWEVYANNSNPFPRSVNVYAICLSGTSATTSQPSPAQVSVPAGSTGSATFACPSGSIVTGGGFASQSDMGTKVYTQDKTTNGWEVFLNNATGSSQLVNAYAICANF